MLFVGISSFLLLLLSEWNHNVLDLVVRIATEIGFQGWLYIWIIFLPKQSLPPGCAGLFDRARVGDGFQQPERLHARLRVIRKSAREPKAVHFVLRVAGAELA